MKAQDLINLIESNVTLDDIDIKYDEFKAYLTIDDKEVTVDGTFGASHMNCAL